MSVAIVRGLRSLWRDARVAFFHLTQAGYRVRAVPDAIAKALSP